MLARCFRTNAMPLERVSSTAEQRVLERLSGLHCSSPQHNSSSSSSTSQSSSSSSGSGIFSGVGGIPASGGVNTAGTTGTAAAAATAQPQAGPSDGGPTAEPCFDPWWAAAEWDTSSSSSSSSFSSSTASSSMDGSISDTGMDLQCELGSSSPAISRWVATHPASVAGAHAAAAAAAAATCQVQCVQPWQQQQLPLQAPLQQPSTNRGQQQQQQQTYKGWGWPWISCSSSSSSTDSNNSSSSSSSDKTSSSTLIAASRKVAPHGSSFPGGCSSSLWYEGGLAAAADVSALHPAVQAYLQGNLGIAFSGGGFRYTYFVGVMDVLLHRLGLIGPRALLSGASSGSLIAVFTKCGLPVEKVLDLTREFSQDCASHGVKGRLGVVLRSYLEEYLPEDAHTLCDGTTFLAVTKVWPTIRTRLFSSFHTRADLINAVMASCHLPTLSDGSFTMRFKGRLHIDGGLLSVLTPPPHAAHTVLVCSMPSAQIAKLPAFISRPKGSDIAISPDTYQAWPFSRSETTALALEPPTPAFVTHMVERGRSDALAWAEAVGFTRNGVPVFPTAQHLEALRQQLFEPAWAAGAVSAAQAMGSAAAAAAGASVGQGLGSVGMAGSGPCEAGAFPGLLTPSLLAGRKLALQSV